MICDLYPELWTYIKREGEKSAQCMSRKQNEIG